MDMTPMDKPPIESKLYDAFERQRFGKSTCFLCGKRLGSKNRTEEHVIPKWAQKRFFLWNQSMILLNGTEIPYRQLTIPCCLNCNSKHLKLLEDTMSAAVAQGRGAVEALGKHKLFLWLGKLFYGLLYKELYLPRDRRLLRSSMITTPAMLRRIQTHHSFLQSVRVPMVFKDFFPASILIFDTQIPDNPKYQWDFYDGYHDLFIACRMGSVGFIAVLQDGGAQEDAFYSFAKYTNHPLHPLQFSELAAMIYTKATTFNTVPRYMMSEIKDSEKPIEIRQFPLQGLNSGGVFNDWNQNHYAHVLSRFTGFPLEEIFFPPDKVASFLRTEHGTATVLNLSDVPWPCPGEADD